MKKLAFLIMALPVLLSSCVVGKKKYEDLESRNNALQIRYDSLENNFSECQSEVASLNEELVVRGDVLEEQKQEYRTLQQKLDDFQKTNTNLLTRLSDLSIVDEKGAESIRKSLEVINQQNAYIADMNTSMKRKDSLNNLLMMKLKRSLVNVDDQDVSVEVRKGVVYISLSDKMLYRSGSARINPAADTVLAKIAKVINDHEGFEVLVEGHTDNVPIGNINCIEDNWDLSAKRAIAVVRKLQKDYGVAPERLTAGGKSYYAPKTDNDTDEGRSLNRRTEIVILPKLDQFFQMMESDNSMGSR
ncbi:MAG: OmpA family protein [Lewinellaceae bacterium]|nr:OmpA family protein [Saprospiraceae bacterium]MCB9336834.1 OmpA family protein [Lewinellaceae bacterium]